VLSRHMVPVASLAWSFGVIAVVLHSPTVRQPVAVPHATASLAGDPVALAVSYLTHADRFYAASVGYAGITPPQVLAWQIIYRSPHAAETFRRLTGDGSTLAGQLYGLAGLYFLDSAAYRSAMIGLRAKGGVVSTMQGCIVSDEQLGLILSEIDKGEWSREFVVGRLLPRG
jgi:hypothetical protein